MPTFKLSVLCDNIEEFQRVALLLLAKGAETANTPALPQGLLETPKPSAEPEPEPVKRPATENAPAEKPRGRGRPKTKASAELALPGTTPAVTLAILQERAKQFARSWGALSLVEILTAFAAKTTTDLKPDQYEAIMKAFDEFSMGEDEPAGEAEAGKTDEDPFNDLL